MFSINWRVWPKKKINKEQFLKWLHHPVTLYSPKNNQMLEGANYLHLIFIHGQVSNTPKKCLRALPEELPQDNIYKLLREKDKFGQTPLEALRVHRKDHLASVVLNVLEFMCFKGLEKLLAKQGIKRIKNNSISSMYECKRLLEAILIGKTKKESFLDAFDRLVLENKALLKVHNTNDDGLVNLCITYNLDFLSYLLSLKEKNGSQVMDINQLRPDGNSPLEHYINTTTTDKFYELRYLLRKGATIPDSKLTDLKKQQEIIHTYLKKGSDELNVLIHLIEKGKIFPNFLEDYLKLATYTNQLDLLMAKGITVPKATLKDPKKRGALIKLCIKRKRGASIPILKYLVEKVGLNPTITNIVDNMLAIQRDTNYCYYRNVFEYLFTLYDEKVKKIVIRVEKLKKDGLILKLVKPLDEMIEPFVLYQQDALKRPGVFDVKQHVEDGIMECIAHVEKNLAEDLKKG